MNGLSDFERWSAKAGPIQLSPKVMQMDFTKPRALLRRGSRMRFPQDPSQRFLIYAPGMVLLLQNCRQEGHP